MSDEHNLEGFSDHLSQPLNNWCACQLLDGSNGLQNRDGEPQSACSPEAADWNLVYRNVLLASMV